MKLSRALESIRNCLTSCCACIPQRILLVFFIVSGLVTCYLMRTSLNLALSEMTYRLPPKKGDNHTQESCDPDPHAKNKTDSKAEFRWSNNQQLDLISSMFAGYIIAHIPAGVLSDMFGGKHVFGAGILLSAVCSILAPTLARLHYYAFMAGRFILGFAQGVMFPASSALVAKWVPPNERSIMSGFVQSGIMIGNAAGLMLSGLILDAFPSWDPIFYICGVIGLVWCLGWYILCYSTPALHPYITVKEKEMIETKIAASSKKKPKSTPWKRIALSLPFFSLNCINFGHAWALFTMINQTPFYLSKVLNYDIKSSGIMSSLPHIAMVPGAIGCGYVADWLIKHQIVSITLCRKLFAVTANILPIPFLIGASFVGCDKVYVIALMVIMMVFKSGSYSSSRANPIDLSPNYAGTLMGIMNGSGAFAGLLGPLLSKQILTGDGNMVEWRRVYAMAAGVMLVFSLPFVFFGSGETQSWNHVEEPTTEPLTEGNPNSNEQKKPST